VGFAVSTVTRYEQLAAPSDALAPAVESAPLAATAGGAKTGVRTDAA
jgi:hypothetical protein